LQLEIPQLGRRQVEVDVEVTDNGHQPLRLDDLVTVWLQERALLVRQLM
jgi:hypothetical protein